jgi:hypothetical protein
MKYKYQSFNRNYPDTKIKKLHMEVFKDEL